MPANLTIGIKGSCVGFHDHIDCYDFIVALPALGEFNSTIEVAQKPSPVGFDAIIRADLAFTTGIIVCFLVLLLLRKIRMGFCAKAAAIILVLVLLVPMGVIVGLYQAIKHDLIRLGYSIRVEKASVWGWASVGSTAVAVVFAVAAIV